MNNINNIAEELVSSENLGTYILMISLLSMIDEVPIPSTFSQQTIKITLSYSRNRIYQ